jgi:hypothetical protein
MVFATLLLGHLVADFPLQTDHIFRLKKRSSLGVLLHVGIHVGIMAVLLQNPLAQWRELLILGVSHFLIDWVKVHSKTRQEWLGFLLDQAAHVSVLVLMVLANPNLAVREIPWWLLLIGLLGALFSAVSMFLWIAANDCKAREVTSDPIQWAQRSMIVVSQRTGRLLLIVLILAWLLAM